jgi:hypothetical protein
VPSQDHAPNRLLRDEEIRPSGETLRRFPALRLCGVLPAVNRYTTNYVYAVEESIETAIRLWKRSGRSKFFAGLRGCIYSIKAKAASEPDPDATT